MSSTEKPEAYESEPDEWRKLFGDAKPGAGDKADTKLNSDGADSGWGKPFMDVMRLRRRPPPVLPIKVFGDPWGNWIVNAAEAAACPPDYIAALLLASASTLIGHARWARGGPGWPEPPHLWVVSVGDSGDGKSPGADCLMRDVLPRQRPSSTRPPSSAGRKSSAKPRRRRNRCP